MADEKQDAQALERKREKERIRARYATDSIKPPDQTEVKIRMELQTEIALRMMLDQVPDEKIRQYLAISYMEIDYVRQALLPKAIKDMGCKNRAMNESLRR